MVRLMDSIDAHNTIDTMKFSSFVADYMYDDDFCDMCDEAHIGPSDFLEQKIGEALDPIRSLDMDDYSKDYSHMVAAKQGYGLDILIDDNNRDVRMTVAHQGYGLDKLINDDYWGVRAEIANQGYGLDKLIHDEEPKVRLLAYDALRAEEEQQKSNQQGKRRVLFVQDNYDDEIENSEFDFDV